MIDLSNILPGATVRMTRRTKAGESTLDYIIKGVQVRPAGLYVNVGGEACAWGYLGVPRNPSRWGVQAAEVLSLPALPYTAPK